MEEDVGVWWAKSVIGSIYLVSGVLGVVGNGLLALVVFRTPDLRSKTGLLLGILAISDGVFCAVNVLNGLNYVRTQFFLGPHLSIQVCFGLMEGPKTVFITTSAILIVALAVDRLAMLRLPVHYKALSIRLYVGAWVGLAALVSVSTAVAASLALHPQFNGYNFCEHTFIFHHVLDNYFLMPIHWSCVLVVIVVNVNTMRLVDSAIDDGAGRPERMRNFQRSLRLVLFVFLAGWTMTVIVGTFMTFVLPPLNLKWDPLDPRPPPPLSPLQLTCLVLIILLTQPNVCSNFFIYMRNNEYRKALRVMLSRKTNAVASTNSIPNVPSVPVIRLR